MHAGGRRKGKGRSRILYWFRTPPGVRVGRAALDEEAIRLLEELNPDVEFDWTRILKGQDAETRPAARKERDYRAERIARHQARAAERAAKPESPEKTESPEKPESPEKTVLSEKTDSDVSDYSVDSDYSADSDVSDCSADSDLPPRPSHARLGSEGLARLRARHAEVLARIAERVAEPARQDELKSQAERLNPDSWVTDDEVTAGLEGYESVFEALRAAVGGPSRRRRRRRRKGGGGRPGTPAEQATEAPGGESGREPGQEEPDEDL